MDIREILMGATKAEASTYLLFRGSWYAIRLQGYKPQGCPNVNEKNDTEDVVKKLYELADARNQTQCFEGR